MEPARKFKIIVNSKECGTCSGATPSEVAKKVVKKLCGTSSKAVRFSLKECKRGCERVCGPYQGRMEKLDRPCKRAGKKITHRVVCGKVKKMRGGFWKKLETDDFNKTETDLIFRIDRRFGLEPRIFFGLNDNKYQYVIYCESWFGGKVVILDNEKVEVNNQCKDIYFLKYIIELKNYLNKEVRNSEFIRIKNYLNTIPYLNTIHYLNTINNLPKCIIHENGIIYLYEHYNDKKVKYNISDGVLSYFPDTPSNKLYQYFILNQNISFEKITIKKINEIGLYNLLKKQEWVFRCSNKALIEKGKLIDIIRTNLKKYEASNNFKSLEVLYSMCSLESLESFNEISNN